MHTWEDKSTSPAPAPSTLPPSKRLTDTLRQHVPLEGLQVFDSPDIVIVERLLLAANIGSIQIPRGLLGIFLSKEFNPAVHEGVGLLAFELLASARVALSVSNENALNDSIHTFRSQINATNRTKVTKQMSDFSWLHVLPG